MTALGSHADGATAEVAARVTEKAAIGKGGGALAAAVGAARAADKLGKLGDVATVVTAGADLAQGDARGAATVVTGAAIDKAVGVAAGAATGDPAVGVVASAVSSATGLGTKVGAPIVNKAADGLDKLAASTVRVPTGPHLTPGPPVPRSLCGLAGC